MDRPPGLFVLLALCGGLVECDAQHVAHEGNPARYVRATHCTWEGPAACPPGQWCDAYRQVCVADDRSADACTANDCPKGTVCVPGAGRCGTPIAGGCYELGQAWWTGTGALDTSQRGEARMVTIAVVNQGDGPLFLNTVMGHLRFDVLVANADTVLPLEIPENHFCPTPCPERGLPMEVDCGAPPNGVLCLGPGERLTTRWSGTELVRTQRYCGGVLSFCDATHGTWPGHYTVKVCAAGGVSGGMPHPKNQAWLQDATLQGTLRCAEIPFTFPSDRTIEVRLR